MGWVEKRVTEAGRARYTAMFRDLKGDKRSAGTFSTERRAAREWQRAEVELADGKITDRRRGLQTLRSYVETQWLPNHVIEATTRESYTYLLNRYILPELGSRASRQVDAAAHVEGPGDVDVDELRRAMETFKEMVDSLSNQHTAT